MKTGDRRIEREKSSQWGYSPSCRERQSQVRDWGKNARARVRFLRAGRVTTERCYVDDFFVLMLHLSLIIVFWVGFSMVRRRGRRCGWRRRLFSVLLDKLEIAVRDASSWVDYPSKDAHKGQCNTSEGEYTKSNGCYALELTFSSETLTHKKIPQKWIVGDIGGLKRS
jgi:hypothetical protein